MESFEKKWCEWSVDDALKWFEFALNVNDKTDDVGDIEDFSSSDDEDEDDETDEKQTEINEEIDFEHVKSRLFVVGFNSKKELPILVKPFQFERFGFKNKKDRKLLCKKTKQLIEKYPKMKSKKSTKKQSNNKHKNKDNQNDVNLEGFVQDTN